MSVKDTQALDLLALLRGHDVDQKVAEFTAMKAQVKHQTVQPEAIAPLFEACRLGVSSPNSALSSHALSCLGHLVKRVTLQEPTRLRAQSHHVLPILIEKLGDAKDRNRTIAFNALLEFFKTCPAEVERYVKEAGFPSRNPRTKQECLRWLAQTHASQPGFSFRSYTPLLMTLLEDANETVRETARDVVIDLFRNAPDHAKSDIKRELQKNGVRKGIASSIISQLGIPGSDPDPRSASHPQDGHGGDLESGHGEIGITGMTGIPGLLGSEMEDLEPAYVNTNRELDDTLHNMAEAFEGRETEHNWLAREKNAQKLRQLARGNAFRDYQATFQAGVKSLLDGILKTANSLRTTLATTGCQLVKDLCFVMGPAFDPMVDIVLPNMLKLCAGTKKITSQSGQIVISVLLASVSYHPKLLNHMFNACNDKNVSPRSYAPGWIAVLLNAHAGQKAYIEHSGGLDMLDKCIKRGLADANPGVRESARATYWKFRAIWPQRAMIILDNLDNTQRKLLEKSDPDLKMHGKPPSSSRVGNLTRSATAPARPSIRDAIAEKRKKAGAQGQEEVHQRPQSPSYIAPTGLASAPVRRPRPGVGAAARTEKPLADAALVDKGSVRLGSPILTKTPSHSYGDGAVPLSPPAHRTMRGVTPGRLQPQQAPTARRVTVMEQLNHSDWKVRVEGVITVACILAKRTPPNYEGQKMPSLPPNDVFAPTLARLLDDPQAEVVEHVLAPEVVAELAKILPMEQIVPKVLLLTEGDDEQQAQQISTTTLPTLKELLGDAAAAELLFRIISNLGSTGFVPKRLAVGIFSTAQKRKIIRGCLTWMNEIVEKCESPHHNEFLTDVNYNSVVNRLIGLLSVTKSSNLSILAVLLKNLERLNPDMFSKILSTFEPQTIRELRKAWGVSLEEGAENTAEEEKVANVEDVLGTVPPIGGESGFSIGSGVTADVERKLQDEDLTLINPLRELTSHPPKVGPDHEILENPRRTSPVPDSVPDLLAESTSSRRNFGPVDPANKPTIEIYNDPVQVNEAHTTHVPEKISVDSLEWQWKKPAKQTGDPGLTPGPEHSARLLNSLIQRLQASNMDSQAFRKLLGIVRENPVRVALQEQNGEERQDIWRSGKVFEALVQSLLGYLKNADEKPQDLKVQGMLVLKQLLTKAVPYFSHHETAILTTLLTVRCKYSTHSQLTSAIEDVLEQFVPIADPATGIDAILDYSLPPILSPGGLPLAGWCMSLSCLSAFVAHIDLPRLEPKLLRLGQLAVQSLNDDNAEVRRSAVNLCIEIHLKLRDDERLFDDILRGVKSGHQNLLAYYFKRNDETRH